MCAYVQYENISITLLICLGGCVCVAMVSTFVCVPVLPLPANQKRIVIRTDYQVNKLETIFYIYIYMKKRSIVFGKAGANECVPQ